MSSFDPAFQTATEIASAIAERRCSAAEVVDATLAAIERTDPNLRAFCTVAGEAARAEADRIDGLIAAGIAVGPLAGVPVAVKDLLFTRGLRTTFGSRLYADFVPEHDDIAVERLAAAGAIVIGKTNAAEFGYGGIGHNPLFPTTRNPWDLSRTPGGSSAGSAAAVAAGVCAIAIGSDGGGSVRLPAAFTGLVGFKGSMGRVPLWPGCRDPDFPGASGWESIEHVGPLTRTVADAALMMAVMAGPDPRDRWSIPGGDVSWCDAAHPRGSLGFRIGYCPRWDGTPVDPEVAAIVEAAIEAFAAAGCEVVEIPAPYADGLPTYRELVALETDVDGLRRMAEGRAHDLSPPVQRLLRRPETAGAYRNAIVERKRVVEALTGVMKKFDLLLTPTVPLAAFGLDRDGPGTIAGVPVEDDAWSPALYPFNLSGQPAASVPAGWTRSGLPVGLQIVGRPLRDSDVIAAAATFEAIKPWAHRRPPVSAGADPRGDRATSGGDAGRGGMLADHVD